MMPQINSDLIPSLSQTLDINLPDDISFELLNEKLQQHINDLIVHDFQKLVSMLYRIDINEEKLKHLLKENADRDAATIIADLIIERQLQKIKSRELFKQWDMDIDENEKW